MSVYLDNPDAETTEGFNQDNPALLYENIFREGGVSASSEDGFSVALNATDGLTYDFWRPTELPASISVEMVASVGVNAAGITFTSAGGRGVTVEIQKWTGSAWETVTSQAGVTERVALFLFAEDSSDEWRIRLSGGSGIPSVADVSIGSVLRFERRIYQGFVPDRFAVRTEYAVNRSRNGQRLGATIVREGIENSVTIDNLTGEWVDDNLPPLIRHVRETLPMYFAWRPDKYQDDVVFCWGTADIKPNNSGPADYRQFSFDYEGIGPDTVDGPQ